MSEQETAFAAKRHFARLLVLVVTGMALLTIGTPRVYAAPLCVNPGGTGGCYSTIQAAVTAAAPGNPITVAAGTYYEHDITIDKSLTITGAGYVSTIVDGQGLGRVFHISTADSVYISGVTIRNGVSDAGVGGGIYNVGNLTLESSWIYSNTASVGGGIENIGTLHVSGSSFIANTAAALGGGAIDNGTSDAQMDLNNVNIGYNRTAGTTRVGGGISMWNGSRATLRFVAIYANGAASVTSETAYAGGGIYARSGTTLTIDQSAIYSNTIAGGNGAGIYSEGTATLTNVTISANAGDNANGGGIQNSGSGTVMLVNSTIVSNTLTGIIGSGGGINNSNASATSVQMKNTIISNNTAGNLGPNCYGAVYSLGYNLENVNSCGLAGMGDLPNTNPRLGPLVNNGGLTRSHALLIGSPAIDGGTNSGCPSVDQRGIRRPLGARCDIGAYEAAMAYLPALMR